MDTIALQEQLWDDVHDVMPLLNTDPEVILAKGQTHYLCHKRNCFSPYDGPVDFIPDAFQAFYRDTDPIDVEIRSGAYGSVRFFPAAELQQQQEAYEVTPEMFVFASVNGDPIFLSDGVVYTYAHGCKGVPWEMLSKDLSSFFQELL